MPTSSLLLTACITLLASLVVAQALVLGAHRLGHLTMDLPGGGVQKFHEAPTPRIGGIGIFAALVVAWLCASAAEAKLLATVLLAGFPALAIGLLEDVTKRVSVRVRLGVTVGSGVFAALLSGTALTRSGFPVADMLLAYWPFAVLFTAFCVGGVSNAFNIIDGFHGLSSGTLILSALGLALVSVGVGDHALAFAAVALAAAVAGFWLVNFPWGKLFLGDGGAYFSGFALAWLTVELLARNPQVSPWCSVLLCGYPTIEVIYSIYRRRRSNHSPGQPDRSHLHSLVATTIVQRRLANWRSNFRNAAVSVLLWNAALITILPAMLFPTRTDILLPAFIACVVAYHLMYRLLERPGHSHQAVDRSLEEIAQAEEPRVVSGHS